MLKYIKKITVILLTILSLISVVNVLVMYWFPIIIPISSFSAVRFTFIAFVEKQPLLIFVSIMIIAILFFSTISIRRRCVFFPMMSLAYLIYDFIIVSLLLFDGLADGYWKNYILQTMFSLVLIVLLCIYCFNFLLKKK